MPIKDNHLIDISFSTMLKAALLIILLWVAWTIRGTIAVILLSIVIASSIEPMIVWLKKFGISRVPGVVLIYLSSFLIFTLIIYLVIPPLFSDILDFITSFPKYVVSAFSPNGPIFILFPSLPKVFADFINSFALSLESGISLFSDNIFSAGYSFFGGLVSFVLLIVISFYLSVQEKGIESFLRIITPLKYESYILDLWSRSQNKIAKWLQGQLLLAVLVGIIVYLGLTILNVRFAISLAVLTALFEIIPVFGPIMAALPAIAVAYVQSQLLGLLTLGLFVLVQQFENHLIYPLVVRKTVGVPPLLAIISLVVGGELGGFMGIVLAVPLASVLVEFLSDVERQKQPK